MSSVSGSGDRSKKSVSGEEAESKAPKVGEQGKMGREVVHLGPHTSLPGTTPVKQSADKVAGLASEPMKAEGALADPSFSYPPVAQRASSETLLHFTQTHLELLAHSHTEEAIRARHESYSLHSTTKQLVIDFVSSGLVCQALWLIQNEAIDLETLRSELPADVIKWIELKLSFKSDATTSLDAMALNGTADLRGLGWGYKSANLTRLEARCNELSTLCSTCAVKVPSFFPLGDFEMQSYLLQGFPKLHEKWAAFLETFSVESKRQFLAEKGSLEISPDGDKILKEIQKGLTDYFTKSTFTTPQFEAWLNEHKPDSLIVRSTGKEDSETNSNAGGNASLAFIKPEAKAISKAMGEVLASYFSEKSILQRIAAHDGSIFSEAPFMPLLIQEMVSEKVAEEVVPDEEVPRSGVMFTRSGGKAEGLTELYVGLGNNEGIVSSRVSTDHYQLDAFGGLAQSTQTKPSRFIARKCEEGDAHECGEIANKSELLRLSPALPNPVAHDLKKVADYFSYAYGSKDTPKALDIEFTTLLKSDGGKPTIYLLQARPLFEVKKTHEPSYLQAAFIETVPMDLKVGGQTLLDGGAWVRTVQSSNQLIVASTIQEALDQFLHSPHKALINTVIIQKKAPGTGHEAVEMRRHGLGVLVFPEESSFKKTQAWHQELVNKEEAAAAADAAAAAAARTAAHAAARAAARATASGVAGSSTAVTDAATRATAAGGAGSSTAVTDAATRATAAGGAGSEAPSFPSEAPRILIDLQRGLVAKVTKVEDGVVTEREGYTCYPMPLAYSMTPSTMVLRFYQSLKLKREGKVSLLLDTANEKYFSTFQTHVESLLTRCSPGAKADRFFSFADGEDVKGKTQQKLLEIMACENKQEAKKAVATLLNGLRKTAFHKQHKMSPQVRLELLMIFETTCEIVEKQYLPALELSLPYSLERLYPIRLLEACLFQQQDKVRGGFSLQGALESIRNEDKLLAIIPDEVAASALDSVFERGELLAKAPILKLSTRILKPELAAAWNESLKYLGEIDAEDLNLINEWIIGLEKLNSLADWANTDLIKQFTNCGIYETKDLTRTSCLALYDILAIAARTNHKEMMHCEEIASQLKSMRSQITVWANPSHVAKQAASLVTTFGAMGFAGDAFEKQHSTCSDSMKLAYLNTMLEGVRLYDEIIKIHKASPAYGRNYQQHAIHFKLLLEGYRTMMQSIVKGVDKPGLYDKMGPKSWGTWPMKTYLDRVDKGNGRDDLGFMGLLPEAISSDECEFLLAGSSEFNVAGAAIGNERDYGFNVSWPMTLEDYFTLFHQNMEVAISRLKLEAGFSVNCLPDELKGFCNQIIEEAVPTGDDDESSKGRISSIQVEGGLIKVSIELPLRQHAAKVLVSYDRAQKHQTMTTKVELFGKNEHQRWELTAGAIGLLGNDLPQLRFDKPQINWKRPTGISFEVTTSRPNEKRNTALITFLRNINFFTMDETSASKYIDEVVALRKIFAPSKEPFISPSAALLGGGFYLGVTAIYWLLSKGLTREATFFHASMSELLAKRENQSLAKMPWPFAREAGSARTGTIQTALASLAAELSPD